jgi:hypothetical protein
VNRPDEIDTDAWDKAKACVFGMEPSMTDGELAYNIKRVARSLMSAKEEAYRDIVDMMEVFAETADFSAMNARSDEEIMRYRIEEAAHTGAAAAVRSLGKVK